MILHGRAASRAKSLFDLKKISGKVRPALAPRIAWQIEYRLTKKSSKSPFTSQIFATIL
jgi:hypothetical protein